MGGLVPRYLTPSQPPEVPEHAGTTDVDVVLNITVLAAKGTYDKLKRQLKDGGFVRYQPVPEGPVSSWQWVYNAGGTPIVVEFLQHTNDPGQSSFLVEIDGEDVSACQILYAGIAHDWFEEKEIVVELPNNGGLVKETIRYADAVAFTVLKALAFRTRHERKDASDLIHVMRYWGSIESLHRFVTSTLSCCTRWRRLLSRIGELSVPAIRLTDRKPLPAAAPILDSAAGRAYRHSHDCPMCA